jgi:hypothetical protein
MKPASTGARDTQFPLWVIAALFVEIEELRPELRSYKLR